MPGAGDEADRCGRVVNRVVGSGGPRQVAGGGALVHDRQQAADGLRVADRQQRQVHGEQGKVAAEREQPETGVAVDVASAQLDEAPPGGQQVDSRALGRAGQRVEHHINAVSIGVASDLLGEVGATGIVDMFDTHVSQQLPPPRAPRGREDLATHRPGDRDGRLPDTARPGVDQHPVGRGDAREVVQAVPGGRCRGRHGSGGLQRNLGRKGDRVPGVGDDERAPAAVRGHAPDPVAYLVAGDSGSDRGHHAGEVAAQILQVTLDGGILAECVEYVGGVDGGGSHRDLDLPGPWWHPFGCNEFQRFQIPGGTDPQAHAVAGVLGDDGSPVGRAQRAGPQPRGVPAAAAPGGLVLIRTTQ